MKGAPMGIEHGKATVTFKEVERCRDLHEFENMGYKAVAQKTGYNINTVKDWLKYKTRTHG